MSWSSAINNLRATGSARTREGNRVPREPPLLGLQSPKLPGGCKSWGGISQFPKLGLCPGGHPKTLNGAAPGLGGALKMPGWTRRDAEPHVPTARAQGDVLGGDFPFQTLQLLVCPPGQEMGPLPVAFSISVARDALPPPGKHRDAESHGTGDRGRTPEPPKAPQFNPSMELSAPLPAVLNAGVTAARGTSPLKPAAPLTCRRRSP